ncbi:DMT family transporter [Mesorhizobium xinjiangense]|uniref:DMT family transporter n=1 Tax=Mesorhizobium xinjiangense TaxID=2678685 RepID=UPI0012EDA3B9|nr:DMT family transporter [Mesorhizobium xinjiangense]
MVQSANLRASIFMSVSMAGFTINDGITKLLSQSMNMGQIMFVRGIIATALIALLAWRAGALQNPERLMRPMVVLRILGDVGATCSFMLALAHLPIANATSILQALPLGVTLGAAVLFAEPVGWRRWLAILAGFLGVLTIIRPGFEGFSAYSLLAFLAVCFCTLRDLATKCIDDDVPSLFVSTATAAAVAVAGATLTVPLGGWSPLDGANTALLAAAAIFLLFGYQFVIMSMRLGDISFVAPFRYTALIWSIALGIVLFGDIPDSAMIAGATIIVLSGLYAFHRERVVGRRRMAAESAPSTMAADGL